MYDPEDYLDEWNDLPPELQNHVLHSDECPQPYRDESDPSNPDAERLAWERSMDFEILDNDNLHMELVGPVDGWINSDTYLSLEDAV